MQSSLMPDVDELGRPTRKKKNVKKPIGLWAWSGWFDKWTRWSRYINVEQAEIVKTKQMRALPTWKWHVGENPPPD